MSERKLTKSGGFAAYFQLVAGVVGIGNAVYTFVQRGASSTGLQMMFGLGLVTLSALSLAAGILLLRKKSPGVGLSRFVQIVQIPLLVLETLKWHTFLLFSLALGKEASGDIFLRWYFGANYLFSTEATDFRFAGINLIALFILWLLIRPFQTQE